MASDIAALDAACEALDGAPPLFNDNRAGGAAGAACYERQRERPEHREMVLMRQLGFTAREIAEKVGYTPAGVNQVLRQPWARQRILEGLHASASKLQDMLDREAAESLLVQLELRDSPATPTAVKAKICDSIMDRALGKATQKVDVTRRDAPVDESIDALQERLNKLRDEERQLSGNAN